MDVRVWCFLKKLQHGLAAWLTKRRIIYASGQFRLKLEVSGDLPSSKELTLLCKSGVWV